MQIKQNTIVEIRIVQIEQNSRIIQGSRYPGSTVQGILEVLCLLSQLIASTAFQGSEAIQIGKTSMSF